MKKQPDNRACQIQLGYESHQSTDGNMIETTGEKSMRARNQHLTKTRCTAAMMLWLLWLLCASFVLADEEAESATPDAAGVEFFEKHVRPILVQHCYECHAGDEVNGGLLLDSRSGVLKGGDTGSAIASGTPDKSLLIEAIRYQNRDLQMPPQNQLSPQDIGVLEKWVTMGAPDPRVAETTSTLNGPTGMSIEEGRRFWSLVPVASPEVPTVEQATWVQTPIDAFVLSELESNALSPANRANKRTLIRRVTFDLIGLPPTEQEVDSFLADESEDAWSTLVERLLESPQYGVRWGRHWLDVARYADSNGLDENLAFGNAWRYRDYVVDAFNSDKPYDRFLVEQIAGDLLPDASQETKTATGFLSLGAKVLAEPDMEKLVMDTIDEQLDSLGKAFMGMTIGCVRCHDHKFDPLKQTDYYALAAIFKSTRTFADTNTGAIKHWHEHSFATPEELDGLKEVDAAIKKKKAAATAYKNKNITSLRTAARAKATEYLMAAALFTPTDSLSVVAGIAEPFGLHPRILHHCRTHLEFNQDTPFFASWHAVKKSGPQAIEKHYRPLFAAMDSALAAAKASDASVKSLQEPRLEEVRAALHDLSGFLAVPPKVEYAFDAETLAVYHQLEEDARLLESSAADESSVLGVGEHETVAALPIHIRGSHLNLGTEVPREFPLVMRVSDVRPVFPAQESGRLQLARWMAGTQHPLTARVYVNRIWGWHFGRGLVSTAENFGRLGDRPSHPELLDWLARRLMESGWSTKDLHRIILNSSTYQMASSGADEAQGVAVDAGNRLLWKFRLNRLEAEQIRDAILAVSGQLDTTIGGKTVPLRNRQFVFNHTSQDHTKYDSLRRALYLPIIRNNLYTLFEQFDFPDPTMPTGIRHSTVVAPQALLMMNSDLVLDSAVKIATALLENPATSDGERIGMLYRRTLSREPTDAESSRALAFVADLSDGSDAVGVSDQGQRHQAWTLLSQSVMASNEFIYVK